MSKLLEYFSKLEYNRFIVASIFLSLATYFCITLFLHFTGLEISQKDDFFANKGLLIIFLSTVIIAPILETFLYQFLIINYLVKQKKIIAIYVSAVFFGISHYYSILYIVSTFFLGLCFAFVFVVSKRRKDVSPFWFVTLIHGIINAIAFFFNDLT